MRAAFHRFSPADIDAMVARLAEKGLHPSVIRVRLAEQGIRWEYGYVHGTGKGRREQQRRLRQMGLAVCTTCQTDTYPIDRPTPLCDACLARKWGGVLDETLPPARP